MEEITFKRLLRWTLASLIVVIAIAYGFGVGIASAESGTITISDDVIKDYTISSEFHANSITSSFYFDVANYNYISSFHMHPDGATYAYDFESTSFTITSGASGGIGYAWYDKNSSGVYWSFPSDLIVTSSTITIAYTKNIFSNVTLNGKTSTANYAVSSNEPIYIISSWAFGGNRFGVGGEYDSVVVSTRATDYYNISYLPNNLFLVNITKNPYVSTQYFIHGETSMYSQEITFDKGFEDAIFTYNDGLYLNATLSSGTYTNTLINSSGTGIPTPAPTPVINPDTGVGIIFDQDDYADGDIANITWSRIISTPFGDTDFIVSIRPDGTEEELISSPPDTGNYKVLMSPAGTWKVEFRRSSLLFGVSVLDSDTATVGAETPSYIYAPANVATGKLFNVTYRIGFTPTANAWIKTYRWIGSDWVYEQAFSATGAKNVETNASILIKDTGKYLIKLCDVIQGCKASTSTTGYFNGTEPTLNITVSNITTDKAAYSYGEYIATNVYVDNSNWSNKAISVDYLKYDTGITNNQQYVQSQVESFNLYVSDLVFPASGNSALRLIGKNDTGTYVLAFKNFTLSSLDAEGYGLSVIGNPTCKGNTGQIKVVVPAGEVANLSISADNAIYNKEYVMNGSKIVPYTFPISGAYYVTLRVNGEAKRLIIVNIGDCIVPANTTWQGQGKIENSCSFWDGWVGNLAGSQGINDLTRFMFALLVIGMITSFTAIITKNLGAGIITGFFPYAFFVFLSLSTPCGQYMPVWTAIFIALIVGIKMRWFN